MAHFKGLFKGIKLALVHFSYKPLLPSQIRPKAFTKGKLSMHFDTIRNTAPTSSKIKRLKLSLPSFLVA